MHYETCLGLPSSEKCIDVFAGWLVAEAVSPVGQEISRILTFVLKKSLNEFVPSKRDAFLARMQEIASAFEKRVPSA